MGLGRLCFTKAPRTLSAPQGQEHCWSRAGKLLHRWSDLMLWFKTTHGFYTTTPRASRRGFYQ